MLRKNRRSTVPEIMGIDLLFDLGYLLFQVPVLQVLHQLHVRSEYVIDKPLDGVKVDFARELGAETVPGHGLGQPGHVRGEVLVFCMMASSVAKCSSA